MTWMISGYQTTKKKHRKWIQMMVFTKQNGEFWILTEPFHFNQPKWWVPKFSPNPIRTGLEPKKDGCLIVAISGNAVQPYRQPVFFPSKFRSQNYPEQNLGSDRKLIIVFPVHFAKRRHVSEVQMSQDGVFAGWRVRTTMTFSISGWPGMAGWPSAQEIESILLEPGLQGVLVFGESNGKSVAFRMSFRALVCYVHAEVDTVEYGNGNLGQHEESIWI